MLTWFELSAGRTGEVHTIYVSLFRFSVNFHWEGYLLMLPCIAQGMTILYHYRNCTRIGGFKIGEAVSPSSLFI